MHESHLIFYEIYILNATVLLMRKLGFETLGKLSVVILLLDGRVGI